MYESGLVIRKNNDYQTELILCKWIPVYRVIPFMIIIVIYHISQVLHALRLVDLRVRILKCSPLDVMVCFPVPFNFQEIIYNNKHLTITSFSWSWYCKLRHLVCPLKFMALTRITLML